MRLILAFAVSFLLHAIISGASHAGIITIDNLASSTGGNSAVNGPLGPLETWTAIRFTTGTGTWQLNSLTARFADQSNGGAGLTPDGLKIEVRSDAGANPGGTLLGSLTSTTNIGLEANYSFSPTASISLAGLTNYWLVAKPTDTNSLYGWIVTASGADNGQSGWSLADNLLGTADSGTSWFSSPLPAVPILSIDATLTSAAVPEPASVAILGLSFLGFSIRRRLRHSAK
jgi:hypothetical protein